MLWLWVLTEVEVAFLLSASGSAGELESGDCLR